ncbi:GPI transamidase component PIG-T [Trema orientale]|uniref:GPI transamidase component PIG-T n=1 Tax=Trema orientale TaxID=63057 RepID=A0A2P5CIA2_TREOI|nr:GPI transamidase component PIG-T [Trema orientale]
MELSFTQGRWNYESWGGFDPIPSNNAKPPGVKSSTSYSASQCGFRSVSGSLNNATLPREAVCTKNLTPWLKLLSCRDKDGIAALMNRTSIYEGFYHSQWLHSTSSELDDSDVNGKCVLAKSSNVNLQLDRCLVAELDNLRKENEMLVADNIGYEGLRSSHGFQLSVKPDRILEEVNGCQRNKQSLLYVFSVEKYSDSEPFDLGLTWKLPVVWSCQQAPLHASIFLMGSGNERGAIAVFVDEQPQEVSDIVEKIRVSPFEDKVSPGLMEMILKFPCGTKSAVGFFHIDEYPPDANLGFDIPSAIISYPDFQAKHTVSGRQIFGDLAHFGKTSVLLVPLTTPDFSMPYNVITITCTVFALYFGSLLNVRLRRVAEEERFLESKDAKKGSPVSQLLSKLSSKLTGRPLKTPQSPSTSSSFISSKLILKVALVAGIAVVWKFLLE